MKALVTGGAGFIGSHLAERLLAEGWGVIVLDDLSNGFERRVPRGAELVCGSAGDPSILQKVLPGCSAIFHLAAVSSVTESIERPLVVHDVNLTTTLALLESAAKHGVKRFVFSSSASVYGDTHGVAARENMVPAPLSHYAVQKLASEYYCGVYHHLRGLCAVCLRYFNVFGPCQRDDSPYTGVITKFLAAARKGESFMIFGDGSQSRDFVHVDDVVAANIAAATVNTATVSGRIFNIGNGISTTVNVLAATIARAYPTQVNRVHAPARPGEILHSRADITLARKALAFEPKRTLTEFLRDTI